MRSVFNAALLARLLDDQDIDKNTGIKRSAFPYGDAFTVMDVLDVLANIHPMVVEGDFPGISWLLFCVVFRRGCW